MSSPRGHNSIFCSVRFNVSLADLILCKLSFEICATRFTSRLNTELIESADFAFGLICINNSYLSVPGQFLSRDGIIILLIKNIVTDVT